MPPLLRSQETLVPAQHLCSTRSASSKHLKTAEGLLEALRKSLETLEAVQASLDEYLELKRSAFPRRGACSCSAAARGPHAQLAGCWRHGC